MIILQTKEFFQLMMQKLSRQLFLLLFLSGTISSFCQDSFRDSMQVPVYRQSFHDRIDRVQAEIDMLDRKKDTFFSSTENSEINFFVSKSMFSGIDDIQKYIERNDKISKDQEKKRYLVVTEALLKNYVGQARNSRFKLSYSPLLVSSFMLSLDSRINGGSIDSLINALPYDVANIIYLAYKGYFDVSYVRLAVLRKYCSLYPEQTFLTLRDNPDVPFADSLIKAVAKKYPSQLYNYAQANNRLGSVIRGIKDDPFVSTIARMARSRSGQQYFPFLDNIIKGKVSMEEIDAMENDSIAYYRLLVKTHLDYRERLLNKDTAYAYKDLEARIVLKARDVFVNTINALHDVDNPAIRFRIIQPLSAEELYYLAVFTDGIIYTSSYTKGVYPLMMKKANNRGDSLLLSLKFDHYRKFISQAAAYNTLGHFLSSFTNVTDADDLMRAFVSRLEKTEGLEDGVDVADSYASIVETLKPRAEEMLKNVQANYERCLSENNTRGIAIYNILNKLFLSADSSRNIDLTKEFGIPPVYNVPFTSLTNANGEVVAQVFFYGDKDGQGIFPGFLNMFPSPNWKIDRSNPQWVVIKSANGKPVTIYANKPLPEETGEDEKAQRALAEFLEENKLNPSITIHRGHSYFANTTISYMAPSSRIVFMGSCGGFHLIDNILRKSGDAHIIASKQIGKTAINKPFFQLLTDMLRNGENIDWIPFWKAFKEKANTEGFEDYIPPYKNLGAIFIKAYNKVMVDNEGKNF